SAGLFAPWGRAGLAPAGRLSPAGRFGLFLPPSLAFCAWYTRIIFFFFLGASAFSVSGFDVTTFSSVLEFSTLAICSFPICENFSFIILIWDSSRRLIWLLTSTPFAF